MKKILFIGNSFTYFNDLPALLETLSEKAGYRFEISSVTKGGWYLHRYLDKEDEMYPAVSEQLQKEWDVVILQEQSFNPVKDPEDYIGAVKAFSKLTGNAAVYLYQTWAYEPNTEKLEKTGLTVSEMYEGLKNAARKAASEIGGTVVPVGDAAFTALNESDIPLYRDDHYHPSPALSYLAAACFFAVLTGQSAMMLPDWDELPKEQCEALRRYAARSIL